LSLEQAAKKQQQDNEAGSTENEEDIFIYFTPVSVDQSDHDQLDRADWWRHVLKNHFSDKACGLPFKQGHRVPDFLARKHFVCNVVRNRESASSQVVCWYVAPHLPLYSCPPSQLSSTHGVLPFHRCNAMEKHDFDTAWQHLLGALKLMHLTRRSPAAEFPHFAPLPSLDRLNDGDEDSIMKMTIECKMLIKEVDFSSSVKIAPQVLRIHYFFQDFVCAVDAVKHAESDDKPIETSLMMTAFENLMNADKHAPEASWAEIVNQVHATAACSCIQLIGSTGSSSVCVRVCRSVWERVTSTCFFEN
jgi:hypothetical protein